MSLSDAYFQFRAGAFDVAEKLTKKEIRANKKNIDAFLLLAQIYAARENMSDCVQALASAYRLQPQRMDVAYNLGVALSMLERHSEAIEIYQAIIQKEPLNQAAQMNLAVSLIASGKPGPAALALETLRAISPSSLDIFHNYLSALVESGQYERVLDLVQHASETEQSHQQTQIFKGRALNGLRRYDEAVAVFEKVFQTSPQLPALLNDMSVSFIRMGEIARAYDFLVKALSYDPQFMQAHHNLGNTLFQMGRFEDSLHCYDRAIQLSPTSADPAFNKAITLLLLEKWDEGFALFEMRKQLVLDPLGVNVTGIKDLKTLSSAKGKHVLVDWEQGLGDTIQFSRLAKALLGQCASVTLRVQASLVNLIQTLDPAVAVIAGEIDKTKFDYHVQMMSLPHLLGLNGPTIPAYPNYLFADPVRVAAWHARLGDQGFKIGISWQGNKQAKVDLGRSFSLEHFRAIAQIAGVRLISLQKNDGSEEVSRLGAQLGIETLGDDFDAGDQAFLDTAAVMESLDLVITSDTAIAHLAGALGRPCWVALQHVPDWRWLVEHHDTPWYPNLRLFRQAVRGDWSGLFVEIRAALDKRLQQV